MTQVGRERLALSGAALLTAWALWLVPDWRPAVLFSDPCTMAIFAAGLVLGALAITRTSSTWTAREPRIFALFLAVMPLIYVARSSLSGTDHGRWVEWAGLAIFGTLAWIGYSRTPWILAAGIAAHGLLWDTWHLHSDFIPAWYALGCLLVDVGLAGYVAVRIRSWPKVEN